METRWSFASSRAGGADTGRITAPAGALLAEARPEGPEGECHGMVAGVGGNLSDDGDDGDDG